MNYIGIDPGAKGGISLVTKKGTLIQAFHCSSDPNGMADVVDKIIFEITSFPLDGNNVVCYIENVWAFPTDMRSSAFKFGKNFGMWLGILAAKKIETILVSPQIWQRNYGELPKNKKDRKNKLKSIATEISGKKATLATADSILIAYYGYKKDKEEQNVE